MNKTNVFLLSYIGVIVCLCVFITGYILVFYPIKYKDEITSASTEFNIAPNLIASMINAESNFNPYAVSSAGAVGLMQLLPTTAQEMALKLNLQNYSEQDLTTPNINIRLGTYYISTLIKLFEDLDTAICAYNAGPNKVKSWLQNPEYSNNQKTLITTPYPATNFYLSKIKHKMNIYSNFF
ncbi:MAG: lytic transglycosylase domain-containing protein [Clostridia bacterium]|nr:lytic transglycosylase domain-containing protein [Clostridia bacterium]